MVEEIAKVSISPSSLHVSCPGVSRHQVCRTKFSHFVQWRRTLVKFTSSHDWLRLQLRSRLLKLVTSSGVGNHDARLPVSDWAGRGRCGRSVQRTVWSAGRRGEPMMMTTWTFLTLVLEVKVMKVFLCRRTWRSLPTSCRGSSTKWWPNVRVTWPTFSSAHLWTL